VTELMTALARRSTGHRHGDGQDTAQRYQTAREVAAAATAALDEAATEVRTESTIPEADSAKPAPPTVC
jgi:hypothetical protein